MRKGRSTSSFPSPTATTTATTSPGVVPRCSCRREEDRVCSEREKDALDVRNDVGPEEDPGVDEATDELAIVDVGKPGIQRHHSGPDELAQVGSEKGCRARGGPGDR